jgi:hypothetical protein
MDADDDGRTAAEIGNEVELPDRPLVRQRRRNQFRRERLQFGIAGGCREP